MGIRLTYVTENTEGFTVFLRRGVDNVNGKSIKPYLSLLGIIRYKLLQPSGPLY